MVRLVAALPMIKQSVANRFVLVGGLAVLSRLTVPHRATLDVDAAVRREGNAGALEILLRLPGAQPVEPAGVVMTTARGDVKVDVIEVAARIEEDPVGDPNDVLYELAHTWAFETAAPMTLIATPSPGGEVITVDVPVALPGPLVAIKLQSAMNRGSAKEATDLFDIVALITDAGTGPVALERLASADAAIVDAARVHAEYWFVESQARTLRAIRRIPEGSYVTPELLDDVGAVLLASLTGA
jgi:hypothetical protein